MIYPGFQRYLDFFQNGPIRKTATRLAPTKHFTGQALSTIPLPRVGSFALELKVDFAFRADIRPEFILSPPAGIHLTPTRLAKYRDARYRRGAPNPRGTLGGDAHEKGVYRVRVQCMQPNEAARKNQIHLGPPI